MEKLTDIVIANVDGPCMVVSMDLAATVVMYATRANVETMIVNVEDGVLKSVNWDVLKKEFVQNKLELEGLYKHVYWENDKKDFDDIWYLMSKVR